MIASNIPVLDEVNDDCCYSDIATREINVYSTRRSRSAVPDSRKSSPPMQRTSGQVRQYHHTIESKKNCNDSISVEHSLPDPVSFQRHSLLGLHSMGGGRRTRARKAKGESSSHLPDPMAGGSRTCARNACIGEADSPMSVDRVVWAHNGNVDMRLPEVQEGLKETLRRAALGKDLLVDFVVYPNREGILLRFDLVATADEVKKRGWISQANGFPGSGTIWHFQTLSPSRLLELINPVMWARDRAVVHANASIFAARQRKEELRWSRAFREDGPISERKFIIFFPSNTSDDESPPKWGHACGNWTCTLLIWESLCAGKAKVALQVCLPLLLCGAGWISWSVSALW